MKKTYMELFCILVGGIVRVIYCLKYSIPTRDSYKYAELIKLWDSTKSIPTGSGTPPFMLFLTKLVHNITNYNIIKCGTAINVVFGILLIVIAMRITWRLTGLNILSLCTGLLMATSPTLAEYSCHFLRESSFLVFTFLAMLFTIDFIKKKNIIYVIAMGICSSLAFLCRYEALEFIVISFFVFFVSSQKMNRKIKEIGLYSLTYLIVIIAFSLIANIPFSYYKAYSERIPEKITTDFM